MRLFLFSLSLLLAIGSFAQSQQEKKVSNQKDWKVVKVIPHKASHMTTDRLGNLYLFDKEFIWLYNSAGDSIAAFNSKRYGEISFVDVTDPYKILVYFDDYKLILYLDNYLSVNGDEIELQELDYDQVSIACQSRVKGFWIYDILKQRALHLNENFKVDKQTINLFQFFKNRIEPEYMMEYNNLLYIVDQETGIYIFDHFGTYLRKVQLTGITQIQIINDKIHYFNAGKFCQILPGLFDGECQEYDNKNTLNLRIEKNRAYQFNPKKTTIFSTN